MATITKKTAKKSSPVKKKTASKQKQSVTEWWQDSWQHLEDLREKYDGLPGLMEYATEELEVNQDCEVDDIANELQTESYYEDMDVEEFIILEKGPAFMTNRAIFTWSYSHSKDTKAVVCKLAADYGLTFNQLVKLYNALPNEKDWKGQDVKELYDLHVKK